MGLEGKRFTGFSMEDITGLLMNEKDLKKKKRKMIIQEGSNLDAMYQRRKRGKSSVHELKWIKSWEVVHVCVLLHASVEPRSQSSVLSSDLRLVFLGWLACSEPQALSASSLAQASESHT